MTKVRLDFDLCKYFTNILNIFNNFVTLQTPPLTQEIKTNRLFFRKIRTPKRFSPIGRPPGSEGSKQKQKKGNPDSGLALLHSFLTNLKLLT